MAFDSTGNLFVTDSSSGNIYEYTLGGVRSTFASGLANPAGLAFNSAGDLFEADLSSGNIYEFTPGGAQSTFASGLNAPAGLAFDSAGNLYVTAYNAGLVGGSGSGSIYKFTPGSVLLYPFIGTTYCSSEGGHRTGFRPPQFRCDPSQLPRADGQFEKAGWLADVSGFMKDAALTAPDLIEGDFSAAGLQFAKPDNGPMHSLRGRSTILFFITTRSCLRIRASPSPKPWTRWSRRRKL